MIAGAVIGLAVMLAVWFTVGAEGSTAAIGGTLLNMAVFGAMFSYIMQGSPSSSCAATGRRWSGPSAARWAFRARSSPSRSRP
jgi:hypothetical protein